MFDSEVSKGVSLNNLFLICALKRTGVRSSVCSEKNRSNHRFNFYCAQEGLKSKFSEKKT